MNSNTRERLLDAATRLFAEAGYRGAPVRDICNHAGANPGAISYHFGGKRQLYRAVLRRAAEKLADFGPSPDADGEEETPAGADTVIIEMLRRIEEDDTTTRLLLRDLADGGTVAVESLTPPLRNAYERLAVALGHGDNPHTSNEAKRLFIAMAAPVFLLTSAWPVIAAVLGIEAHQRSDLLADLVRGALPTDDQITGVLQ
jgi:AcrR family transcriptional regulator